MRRRAPPLLASDKRGISAVEFALIAPVFLLLLMGGLDIAYQAYVRSTAQGALETLTRSITVQGAQEAAARTRMDSTIHAVAPSGMIDVTRGSVSRFRNFGAMERLTQDLNNNGVLDGPVDTDHNGIPDKSDCWEDIDNNGVRNVVTVGADGIGGADDIVRYKVDVSFRRLFPISTLFNLPEQVTVSATSLVRRQPYESQAPAPIRCKQ